MTPPTLMIECKIIIAERILTFYGVVTLLYLFFGYTEHYEQRSHFYTTASGRHYDR